MPGPDATDVHVTDRAAADFEAGSADAGLHLMHLSSGPEIILAPTVAGSFGGALPAHWFTEPWKEGGRVEQSDGAMLLDAATVGFQELFPSERSLEFGATFQKRPHQHIGFGTNFRTVPWITFSTKFGHGLYARSNFLIPEENRLASSLVGSPHRFRIDWKVLEVEFGVDGRRVAHQLVPMVGWMRPLASNASLGADPLALEWMRMSPYAREGTFTSRVHDAGRPAVWAACDVDADVPRYTTLAVAIRTGRTPEPGRGWSPWTVPEDGTVLADGAVRPTGRFAQYQVTLATEDPSSTPVLRTVTLRYSSADG